MTSLIISYCSRHPWVQFRAPGALESASAVSRARARKGDVSRPEQSGGRVTATGEAGRHERVAPTRKRTLAAACPRRRRGQAAGGPPHTRPANRGVRAKRGRSGSGHQERKSRRAEAVTAKRLSADGPKFKMIADEWSVRRTRSRPCKSPRPGSLSEAKSAGTGQRESTFCRRVVPVAAKRSSGAARRQEGSPFGADGSGC